jgi:hypothetical protein
MRERRISQLEGVAKRRDGELGLTAQAQCLGLDQLGNRAPAPCDVAGEARGRRQRDALIAGGELDQRRLQDRRS